jgi:hypothetical protein
MSIEIPFQGIVKCVDCCQRDEVIDPYDEDNKIVAFAFDIATVVRFELLEVDLV